jgi:CRISPR system Cascade subunit CasB
MTTTTDTTGHFRRPIERVLERVAHDPAALAALRRGLGKVPGEAPETWPYTVQASSGAPTDEAAAHHALTLYAVHQQSQPRLMHQRDRASLGRACARLARVHDSEAAATRRFTAAATADSLDELAVHARGLVTLLRDKAIPLDYVQLYDDLRAWANERQRGRVRRRWGRDFHRFTEPPTEHADETTTDEGEQ